MDPKKNIKLPAVDHKQFKVRSPVSLKDEKYLTPQLAVSLGFSDYINKNRRNSVNTKLPSLSSSGSNSPAGSVTPSDRSLTNLRPMSGIVKIKHPDLRKFEFKQSAKTDKAAILSRQNMPNIKISFVDDSANKETDYTSQEIEEKKTEDHVEKEVEYKRYKYKKNRDAPGIVRNNSENNILFRDDN